MCSVGFTLTINNLYHIYVALRPIYMNPSLLLSQFVGHGAFRESFEFHL